MPKPDPLYVPEGRNPAEFLNDAQLAEYYTRQAAEASEKDKPALDALARQHRRSAAITAAEG